MVDIDGATAAFRSGVTEVAFFTMPTRPDEAARTAIEAGSANVLRDVQEIGKAFGAAIGWCKSRYTDHYLDLTLCSI